MKSALTFSVFKDEKKRHDIQVVDFFVLKSLQMFEQDSELLTRAQNVRA